MRPMPSWSTENSNDFNEMWPPMTSNASREYREAPRGTEAERS
jgi:hypothetical protein